MHGGSPDDTGRGPTKCLHSRNQMTKQNYETCAAGTVQGRSLAWANLSEGSFRIRAQNLKNPRRGLIRGGPNIAPINLATELNFPRACVLESLCSRHWKEAIFSSNTMMKARDKVLSVISLFFCLMLQAVSSPLVSSTGPALSQFLHMRSVFTFEWLLQTIF